MWWKTWDEDPRHEGIPLNILIFEFAKASHTAYNYLELQSALSGELGTSDMLQKKEEGKVTCRLPGELSNA
jgi:hypothetical protein